MRRFFYDTCDPNAFNQPLSAAFIPNAAPLIPLTNEIYHHWCRVLRAKTGDSALLFDGYGGEYHATLHNIDKKNAFVSINDFVASERTPAFYATLLLGVSRSERLDYAIQKSTELGISAIQLVYTDHGDKKFKDAQIAKKLQHWQQIAISACEQCGMNRPPIIFAPIHLPNYINLRDELFIKNKSTFVEKNIMISDKVLHLIDLPFYKFLSRQPDIKITLSVPLAGLANNKQVIENKEIYNFFENFKKNTEIETNLIEQPSFAVFNDKPCLLMVCGSEGGFSDAEHQLFTDNGYRFWHIGSRVLRTETAPVVALSALITLNDLAI